MCYAYDHLHCSRILIGRFTRPFTAYDSGSKRIVFLKGTWRVKWHLGLIPEHRIYERLKNADVPNIPECYGGADITDQLTLTQTQDMEMPYMQQAPVRRRRYRTFRHYCLVLEHVDGPLDCADTTKTTVSIVRDAAKGEALSKFDERFPILTLHSIQHIITLCVMLGSFIAISAPSTS